MAYVHTPLTDAELGPAVLKMAGDSAPQPMRTMVARGVAPLPPRDLLVALYHFWVNNDPDLSGIAAKTIEGLPLAAIEGALADRNLHSGVLDLLGRKMLRNEEVLDKIVRHPNADDQTLVGIGRICPESVCETLADNQERWLKCAAIVGGLYQNRNCRMSVIHRMIELAEREGLDLKLPAMDEIRTAMKGEKVDESRDDVFSSVVHGSEEAKNDDRAQLDRLFSATVDDDLELPAQRGNARIPQGSSSRLDEEAVDSESTVEATEPEQSATRERRLQTLMKMNPMEKIRAALLGDKYDRSVLVRDSNKVVAMATIKSPKIRDSEAIGFSANRSISHDVIRYIANRREWIKLYAVKLSLVMNPKTPMARSMGLLAHLNRMDVQKVARSKNIPSALAKAAKRKSSTRG